MNKEKWYKRDDVEYWKKEYLELSKQLEKKDKVLDKIKENLKNIDFEYLERLLELLEEIK